MEILIAGSGIGGLAAALSLHAAGFENVRVVDAATDLRPLGVGLNILPNAVHELTELGLYDELAANAILTQELALYNRYGSLIWSEPRGRAAGYRWPQFSIHRGFLQMVLAKAVRACLGESSIMTDARVSGFTTLPNGRVRVPLMHRTSGTTSVVDADVLIGADGIRSAVRAALYPQEGEPPWNGLVMWRGTTWSEPYLTGRSMIVAGDDTQRLVFYPIQPAATPDGPVLINWVIGRPADGDIAGRGNWNQHTYLEKVLKYYGDWRFDWLDIGSLLRGTAQVFEYPMIDRDPLPRWTFGRVTLLGDAAHAMYPMGSNGATQAIVDARALAFHLATEADVDAALVKYDHERRHAVRQVQLSNRKMGPERVINMAHERAPNGFDNIHDVIAEDELAAVSTEYARIAGFDVETVNTRPSYNVCST